MLQRLKQTLHFYRMENLQRAAFGQRGFGLSNLFIICCYTAIISSTAHISSTKNTLNKELIPALKQMPDLTWEKNKLIIPESVQIPLEKTKNLSISLEKPGDKEPTRDATLRFQENELILEVNEQFIRVPWESRTLLLNKQSYSGTELADIASKLSKWFPAIFYPTHILLNFISGLFKIMLICGTVKLSSRALHSVKFSTLCRLASLCVAPYLLCQALLSFYGNKNPIINLLPLLLFFIFFTRSLRLFNDSKSVSE